MDTYCDKCGFWTAVDGDGSEDTEVGNTHNCGGTFRQVVDLGQIRLSTIDPHLLRIYLGKMPPGRYHLRDDSPCWLRRDGKRVAEVVAEDGESAEVLVAALVHILNTRTP